MSPSFGPAFATNRNRVSARDARSAGGAAAEGDSAIAPRGVARAEASASEGKLLTTNFLGTRRHPASPVRAARRRGRSRARGRARARGSRRDALAMDANPFTADALAAAAADGDRVCLSNLLVRHRKRRGAKMFFATASAEAGWDVQLSFMTRRGKAHDDAETSVRLTPEAHAAAYEGCAPGATIDKVWGALERGRVVSTAETDAREADDTSDFDDTDDGAPPVKTRGRPIRERPAVIYRA